MRSQGAQILLGWRSCSQLFDRYDNVCRRLRHGKGERAESFDAFLKNFFLRQQMKVGFTFKNGIVLGTADSTVPAVSNLEFVSEVKGF